ncbi:MAG: Holliday junction resolvase RuvX [Oscillatoriales cyanobacterium SM2_1_8]|nr:Holliday junction resolvase RuvX [Oscillatoriales cyanobacterium SM2_1_8]
MGNIGVLGLDVGRKRIGIAGCDRSGLIAFGITTLVRRSWPADMAALAALIQERAITLLVVGYPYNMDGSVGPQARAIEKFAQGAAAHLGTGLAYTDERLTSIAAEEQLRIQQRRYQKEDIDRVAAAILLQQWLDRQRALGWPNLS